MEQARKHGVERFVLADINNTSCCLEITRLCKKSSFLPVLGIDFRNDLAQKFIGIARNQNGFEKLNRLLSKHLKDEIPFKDKCEIRNDVFVIYPFNNDVAYDLEENEFIGVNYKDLHYLRLLEWETLQHKMVVLHPVSFSAQDDFHLHKLLRTISKNTILSKIRAEDLGLADEYFLDENDFMAHYGAYPKIIQNTFELLENCETIDFELGKNKNKSVFNKYSNKLTGREVDYNQLVALVE
ncbi:MAG: hypothetical protein ABIP95_11245, partial [Pelobium sp.]